MRLTLDDILEKAINNNWCWNITCTTCGHIEFYESLNELSNSNHSITNIKQGRKRYGGLKAQAIDEVILQTQKLNLKNLSIKANFPDWLGYIGLILYYTSSNHPKFLSMSNHIINGLLEILPSNSRIRKLLQSKMELEEPLEISELELIEKEIKAHNKL
jgi:hypothetical protein